MEKARELPADCLILDLEDAVAPAAKESARERVVATIQAGGYGPREIIARINGLDTEWGETTCALWRLQGLMLSCSQRLKPLPH